MTGSGKIYFRFKQKLTKRLLDVANSIGNYINCSKKLFWTSGDHRKWLNSLPVYTKSSQNAHLDGLFVIIDKLIN